jgi:hypothetical protein
MSLFPEKSSIESFAAPTDRFLNFVGEREAIRRRRVKGSPWPWTTDPILQNYRFCNVERERDRTTRDLVELWFEPHRAEPDLWFASAVARQVNWVPTLKELGFPIPFNADQFIDVMAVRRKRGEQIESAAYRIHADNSKGSAGVPKAVYIANKVLKPLWARRKVVRPKAGDWLEDFCNELKKFEAIDGFMAGQIIADVKYSEPLKGAPDWWTFASSGPGSRTGLNRVLGRKADAPWSEPDWCREVGRLASVIAPGLKMLGLGRLHNQDLQNCLCEFARYEKLRLGEGTGRRYFGKG